MTAAEIMEVFKTLGVALPLVAVLFYLLRQANEERQAITTNFLKTLSDTVAFNADGQARHIAAITELTATLKEGQLRTSQEHVSMIEAITKLSDRGGA